MASVIVHSSVVRAIAGARGTGLPASYLTVYRPELALLALAGLVIGVARALLPASWAARARAASSLRAERPARQGPADRKLIIGHAGPPGMPNGERPAHPCNNDARDRRIKPHPRWRSPCALSVTRSASI